MKIASILENQKIEKRITITPEIAKKYISLGFEVILSNNHKIINKYGKIDLKDYVTSFIKGKNYEN